jgi:hypothetical protein
VRLRGAEPHAAGRSGAQHRVQNESFGSGYGNRIVAPARVIRAGRTVTVSWADVVAMTDDTERLVATMVATMMTVRDRGLTD